MTNSKPNGSLCIGYKFMLAGQRFEKPGRRFSMPGHMCVGCYMCFSPRANIGKTEWSSRHVGRPNPAWEKRVGNARNLEQTSSKTLQWFQTLSVKLHADMPVVAKEGINHTSPWKLLGLGITNVSETRGGNTHQHKPLT